MMNNSNNALPALGQGLFDPNNSNMFGAQQGQQQALNNISSSTPLGALNSLLDEGTVNTSDNTLNGLEQLLSQGKVADCDADFLAALTPTPLDPSIGGSVGLGRALSDSSSLVGPSATGPVGFHSSNNLRSVLNKNGARLTPEDTTRFLAAGFNELKAANSLEPITKLKKDSIEIPALNNGQLHKSLGDLVSLRNQLKGKGITQDKQDKEPSSQAGVDALFSNAMLNPDVLKGGVSSPSSKPFPLKSSSSPVNVTDCIQDSDQRNDLNSLLLKPFSDKIKPSAKDEGDNKKQKGPGGYFPRQVFQMLSDLETQEGGTAIASFLPHGRAFSIHKPKEFVEQVMPKYFRMSQFASFQRQLNLYGFRRIKEGPDKGAYFHELFVHGQHLLCTRIRRKKTKQVRSSRGDEFIDFDDFEDVF